jgi:cell division protein FtsN
VKGEIEPASQVIRTSEMSKSTGKESALSLDSTYTLQVAAYRTKSDAKQLQQWLRERGYQTRIEGVTIPESGPWYRVRFGMYDSYNAAKKTAETFRKQFDFYCWIVPVDS